MRRLPLLVMLALAVAPAAARASVVSYSSSNVLEYQATPGEVNKLTVTRSGDQLVFTEGGGVTIIEAEADCTGSGTSAVSCKILRTGSVVNIVVANLNDMDDSATTDALAGINPELLGEDGADTLDGSLALLTGFYYGGDGIDKITAGAGLENQITGGAGADLLIGGPLGSSTEFAMGNSIADDGNGDEVRGGAGLDIVSYEDRANPVTLSADGKATSGEATENDTIGTAVESIEGGRKGDTLTASDAVDGQLSGYDGNDTLNGGARDDKLFGGLGDDTVFGNGGDDISLASDRQTFAIGGGPVDGGADAFTGGAGFDTMDYSSRTAPVSVSLDGTANDGEADEKDNVANDVEEILGGTGSDTLGGSPAANRIVGNAGNDTIDPGAGSDEIRAGSGTDTINVRDSVVDTVDCGIDADTLTGDSTDILTGCETANLAPVATPTASPTVPPVAPDTTKPTVTISALKTKTKYKTVRKGVKLTVTTGEPAAVTIDLLGAARTAQIAAKFNLALATKTFPLSATAHTVKLKAPKRLLGKRRKLKLQVRITATDAAGNVTTVMEKIAVAK